MKNNDSAICLGDVPYATCWGCGRWEELSRGLCWVCQAADDLEDWDWIRRQRRPPAPAAPLAGARTSAPKRSTGPDTYRQAVAA